jgi:hypothetical protein
MKKIILFLITFFISITSLFAENKVNIWVSQRNVNIWDNINLQINISSSWNSDIEIAQINWIDNFKQLSQSQSRQVQIINGESSSIYTLQLDLQPINTWSYILWPVSVEFWDELIHSDPIEITVNSENIPRIKENNNKNLDNNLDAKKQNIVSDKNEKQLNDLDDIHTVKKLELQFWDFKYKWVIYFSLFVIFLIIFYVFLLKILENRKAVKKLSQENVDKINNKKKEIDNIYWELLILSDDIEKYSQEEFYAKLNNLFRKYFLYIWINKADKKTLSELKNDNIDSKIFDIFSMSYMYEFSTQQDNLSDRKQITMNFMLYLKK